MGARIPAPSPTRSPPPAPSVVPPSAPIGSDARSEPSSQWTESIRMPLPRSIATALGDCGRPLARARRGASASRGVRDLPRPRAARGRCRRGSRPSPWSSVSPRSSRPPSPAPTRRSRAASRSTSRRPEEVRTAGRANRRAAHRPADGRGRRRAPRRPRPGSGLRAARRVRSRRRPGRADRRGPLPARADRRQRRPGARRAAGRPAAWSPASAGTRRRTPTRWWISWAGSRASVRITPRSPSST